jgi:GT2 family glycosyltransferase
MSGSITSVLVNWNLAEDTLACVGSLLKAGAAPDRILVVDNQSSDGSVEMLESRFGGEIRQIQSGSNLGFAGGANLGIQAGLSAGADWIFLLNNDTIVSPQILEMLSDAADRHPEYAILAPTIYYFDEPRLVWFYGERLIPGTLLTKPLVKDEPLPARTAGVTEVDFVSGCGMMVRRDVFERIGLFDADLFMYGEEVDFLWRSRREGFRIAVIRDASMWHKVSKSSSRDRPMARFYRVRNQSRFYRKNSRGFQAINMFMFSGMKTFWTACGDLFHGRTGLLGPLLRGWYTGWFKTDGIAN